MLFQLQSFILPLLSLFFSNASSAPTTLLSRQQPPYDSTACNNYAALCEKKYSDVFHLGAHDSPFLRNKGNGYSLAGNQFLNVRTQLDAGVRLLQGQIHSDKRVQGPRLCHSDCSLMDGGSLEDYLIEVKTWMDEHPSEVVTMLWVNSNNIPAADIARIFESTGLKDKAFQPGTIPLPRDGWPTLGEMVKTGKRLVVFLSTTTDPTNIPWILGEFSHIFETKFENFEDDPFTCSPDRPSKIEDPEGIKATAAMKIPLFNRFLYRKIFEQFGAKIFIPDPQKAAEINSGDHSVDKNLKDGIETCMTTYGGKRGGFILVDFFNDGNPIKVIDAANGLGDSVPKNRIDPPVRNTKGDFTPEEKTLGTKSAGELSKGFDLVNDIFEPGKAVDELHNAIEKGGHVVDDVKEKVPEVIDEGKNAVEDLFEKGKDKVVDVVGGLKDIFSVKEVRGAMAHASLNGMMLKRRIIMDPEY